MIALSELDIWTFHLHKLLSSQRNSEYVGGSWLHLPSSPEVCSTGFSPAMCLEQMFSREYHTQLHAAAAFIPLTSCHKHFQLMKPRVVIVYLANA